MFDIRKGVIALCLSGAAIGGTAGTALAATASTSQTSTTTVAAVQTAQVIKWCGYQVVRAPKGLLVRVGPKGTDKVVGSLRNGQRTTGDCAKVRNWVHLSEKYNHYRNVPKNARGWSDGRYLAPPPPPAPSTCKYTAYRAPNGLLVRSGPGTGYGRLGWLRNDQQTTGDCGAVKGWVHLSDKYNHDPRVNKNARGWSDGHYLRKG